MKSDKKSSEILSSLLNSFMSVLLAIIIGSIVLLISGFNPIVAYRALIYGAFGNMSYFGDTLASATPILFTGLAVGFGFKAGMFNIGAEGQLLMGALAAAIFGYAFDLPLIIHLPLSIIVGMLFSGMWALVPGVLRARKGVHEVITTIMMNYIAYNLSGYVTEKLRVDAIPKTPDILQSAKLARMSSFIPAFKNSNLNLGFIIAIITAIIIYILINKTVFGYEVRALGFNPLASEDAGVNVKRKVIIVMVISGMLAGLAGVERALGVYGSYIAGLSSNFGFEGIAVALLANNNPIGIIFSAILFGALSSGGNYMNLAADVPVDIVGIIQGLIVLFAACGQIFKFTKLKKQNKNKEVKI